MQKILIQSVCCLHIQLCSLYYRVWEMKGLWFSMLDLFWSGGIPTMNTRTSLGGRTWELLHYVAIFSHENSHIPLCGQNKTWTLIPFHKNWLQTNLILLLLATFIFCRLFTLLNTCSTRILHFWQSKNYEVKICKT